MCSWRNTMTVTGPAGGAHDQMRHPVAVEQADAGVGHARVARIQRHARAGQHGRGGGGGHRRHLRPAPGFALDVTQDAGGEARLRPQRPEQRAQSDGQRPGLRRAPAGPGAAGRAGRVPRPRSAAATRGAARSGSGAANRRARSWSMRRICCWNSVQSRHCARCSASAGPTSAGAAPISNRASSWVIKPGSSIPSAAGINP